MSRAHTGSFFKFPYFFMFCPSKSASWDFVSARSCHIFNIYVIWLCHTLPQRANCAGKAEFRRIWLHWMATCPLPSVAVLSFFQKIFLVVLFFHLLFCWIILTAKAVEVELNKEPRGNQANNVQLGRFLIVLPNGSICRSRTQFSLLPLS